MKAEQVDQALEQKFLSDGQRLVFWHDGAGEFAGYIDSGLPDELSEVQILELAQVGGLSAKLKLEREDSVGKYLIYSQGEQPQAEEDWLLDIRLYSTEFHADIASIWLQELGLSGLYLRDHLKARSRFMANQERRRKLSRLIDAGDDEDGIDLKMMAVLVGSQEPSRATVLRSLCHGHVVDGRFNLEATPQAIEAFHKMDLLPQFWNFVQQEFGYQAERPSLAGLLRRLLISELFYQTDNATISALAHHQLPAAGRSNAVVFLTHWRDSSIHAASYDATAMAVAKEQKVELAMETLGLEAIQQVFTFWPAEQLVLSGLKDRVLSEKESLDLAGLKAVVGERQSGHWLAGPGRDLSGRQAAFEAYNAILAAAELFDLYQTHRQRLKFDSAEALLKAYQQDLYRFDYLYRRFCSQADASTDQGWDLLKTLAEEVDRIYIQGFLQPLGIEWSRLLDQGFLKRWSMAGMPGQHTFFTKTIRPHLKQSDRKRAFVIISDAFRYEAAKQLNQELNGRYRMQAELSSMLGVLPSYTALGMASLLPHQTLTYNPAGEVLLDGKSVAGTEARSQQLATVEGMACQARDLLKMKQAAARQFTAGKRIVYIYHNVIDALGDSALTEGETFQAVTNCISELVALVQLCVNKLNAAKVWVTADHGFLFQQPAPDEMDKSKLEQKPAQAFKMHKRYLIGPDLGTVPEAHHGTLGVTAGAGDQTEFWLPRATNLFNFSGGARFVHGGAMPQEVVIPLVTITQLRGTKKEDSHSRKVSVQVLGTSHKITTPKYRFELIQTEAVGERRQPIILRAAVFEGAQAVTSVETVTFDSSSDDIEGRKKSILLELRSGTFNKTTDYRLVLREVETEAEIQSVPVIIDRSFDDDF